MRRPLGRGGPPGGVPTDATYLADNGKDGYLVLTAEADQPDCAPGWSVEPVNLDTEWYYDDGLWRVRLVAVRGTANGTCHNRALFCGLA